MNRTVGELLKLSREYLSSHGIPTPDVEAEILLSWILNSGRTELYIRSNEVVSDDNISIYRDAVKRRAMRMPLSYITGQTEFFGLEFAVDKNCLIPRQETEILVEETIKIANKKTNLWNGGVSTPQNATNVKILDIGCGCGNISIALARKIKNSTLYCVDIDEKAVAMTCLNAINNGVYAQLRIYKGDLFSPFENNLGFLHSFDIIVSNPPYIPEAVIPTLEPEVSVHEPKSALCGGSDGLEFYRRIIPASKFFLKDGGHLMFEVGHDQATAVSDILKSHGFTDKKIIKDYSDFDRVVIASNKL